MSDIPELIEPINVEIEQIDKTTTVASTGVSGRREFVGNIQRKTKIVLSAQVAFSNTDMITKFNQIGPDEQAKGYLVLRFIDLANKGVTLQKGDKIIKLGQLDVEYYLLHGTGDPAAHFSSISGFTLFRMFFGDRNPVGS